MKEFLMIFRNEKKENAETPSAEQMQAVMSDWQNWIAGVAAQGKFVGTNRLYSGEAKSLTPDGVIIDGPYAEVKEIIGGYLLIKTDTLEDAVEIAKACPGLKYGGKVEVRTVLSIVQDHTSKDFLTQK